MHINYLVGTRTQYGLRFTLFCLYATQREVESLQNKAKTVILYMSKNINTDLVTYITEHFFC